MTISSTMSDQYLHIKLTTNNSNFDNIISITDPNVLMKAIQTAGLFQNALVPAQGDSLRFDVQKGLDLVKQTPGLSVTNFTDIAKQTTNRATSVMVEMVLATIKTVLGIVLAPEPTQQLVAAIEGAYVGLNERKDSAWVFWERREAHKTTYQYNITFSVEAGPTGLLLLTCPMGLTIEVSQSYERVLFITLRDEESYLCRIQSLTVAQVAKPITTFADLSETRDLIAELTADGIVEIK